MRDQVAVTGLGLLSSLGTGPQAFVEGLLAGRSGIETVSRFGTEGCRSHAAAVVRDFDPARYIEPLKLRRIDEVGRLALAACKLAAQNAGWPNGAEGIGVVLGSATAGLHSIVRHLQALTTSGPASVPALGFSNTVGNAAASLCAIELGLHGPNMTVGHKQVSGLEAIAVAAGWVRAGRGRGFLCGGADDIEEQGFRIHDRFGVLSPGKGGGCETSRPFSSLRNGFVLGSGGHMLALEAAESAAARGAAVYGEILGFASGASDCVGAAWPSRPDGIVRTMRGALDDAGIGAAEVSAVFAAANSSRALDRVEALAIDEVFGPNGVPVVSVKGALGEYGAAGPASVVAALLCLSRGVLPPTLGCDPVDPACRVAVSAEPRQAAGRVALVNASADGGAHCSVVVRAAASPR